MIQHKAEMVLARSGPCVLAVTLVAVCLGKLLLVSEAQQPHLSGQSSKFGTEQGKRTFTSACAGCHGLDGRGGERAPNIANSAKVERRSDDEIAAIISNGIPGTGMPAFHYFRAHELRAIVRYLRVLQGRGKSSALPGNPALGKRVFWGKGECSSCHMLQGEGGFIGPDLSSYALTHSPKEILDAIISPEKAGGSGQRAVAVLTREGHQFSGLVRNEDNFSVQLQSRDGAFHFFLKSELETLAPEKDPLMPTDYGQRLSAKELDDLASYLMTVGRASKVGPNSGDED